MSCTHSRDCRALSATEIARVRDALGNLQFVSAQQKDYDGEMISVAVDDPSGHRVLTPDELCGTSTTTYNEIIDGLPGLQAAFDSL
jgi:hypothetical protein